MELKDSTVLVTGGGSGLGGATARAIVAAGGRVVIADVNRDAGQTLAEELGASARFVATDVTDEVAAKAAVDAAVELGGRIDGLVNCAGIVVASKAVGRDGPHDLASFTRCIQINLIGTFNMIRLAAAAMQQQEPNAAGERGVIVNTASVAAYDGQIGQVAYAASKSGVVGMTLPLAREFARAGIRVLTIAPGLFETPMMSALPEAAREALGQITPFPPRLGKAEEFASLACYILTNTMLNGETIRLDGAVRLPPK
ncbi:SDR family NAD(P)-dependent oxidoreductase [uncultured Abyssibacter sp.]|uniref:SDR family NAD(P)-dependent oxidoreductase n=1 Tax=uncultured Abyssibacter sp. TaxID=2320202 RepID=UPI0032B22704